MASQAWLLRRLAGLEPCHFEERTSVSNTSGVCLIGCCAELEAPSTFHDVWSNFLGGDDGVVSLTAQQLSGATALLIFSNPFIPEQVRATSELVSIIDAFGANAPPMFWITHTVSPEVRAREHFIRTLDDNLLRILEMGLDGIIPEEPAGMKLALEVRMRIQKSDYMSQTLNNIINTRRAHVVQGSNLKDQNHSIMWDYLCVRMAPSIPPCNHSLPPNQPREIGGLTVGPMIMQGAVGSVYTLGSPEAQGQVGEVVKIVEKAKQSKVQSIRRLKSSVDVMHLVTKEQWQHPNLVKLNGIYHSRTHLVFRMDYCGSDNLFQRLKCRDAANSQVRPLPLHKARSIILQLISVVAHLHTGPGVCLRDIKPEKVNLIETPEAVTLKLLDLDLAAVLGPQVMCRVACGTIPFVAPEVLIEREYDGRAADTWSLGMVLLELLCFVEVMEGVLELSPRLSRPDPQVARHIAEKMSRPHRVDGVLQHHCRKELRQLQQPLWPVTRGMLSVDAALRWRSDQAHSHVVAALRDMPQSM
mmetsp:Transcript_85476/g.227053  ORF Transcript_85476/g.227053 Transcript_85476/m.227053 type:complete len:528 (-) Transcript_85476:120-1703(-)